MGNNVVEQGKGQILRNIEQCSDNSSKLCIFHSSYQKIAVNGSGPA